MLSLTRPARASVLADFRSNPALAKAADTVRSLQPNRPRVERVDTLLVMDAVLEKVSNSGMASLTDEERSILKRASEVMKRRKT